MTFNPHKKQERKPPGIYPLNVISPEQVREKGKRFWILGKEYAFNRCGVEDQKRLESV